MRLMKNVLFEGDGGSYCDVLIGVLQTPRDREKGSDYEEMSLVVPVIRRLMAQRDRIAKAQKAGDVAVAREDHQIRLAEAEWKELYDRLTRKGAGFQVNSVAVFEVIEAVVAARHEPDAPPHDLDEQAA